MPSIGKIQPYEDQYTNPFAPKPVVQQPSIPQTYNAAVQTQAGDYDRLMKAYQGLQSSSANPRYSSITPTFASNTPFNAPYYKSPEMGQAMSGYGQIAQTGGYSGEDIANLRARGISPIRSIYANAMRNVDRQRSLQGGYSPNYAAVSAKMARELSESIASKTTDVNAQLAQMIASGRLSGLAGLAPLAAQETGFMNEMAAGNVVDRRNVGAMNTQVANAIAQFNAQMKQQNQQQNMGNMFNAIQGQQSLYGTTPALASLFGQQALAQQGQENQWNLGRGNLGLNTVGSAIRNPYGYNYSNYSSRG